MQAADINSETLSRFKSDVLLLIDLVAADSDSVKLTEPESLKERFIEKASRAPLASVDKLKAELARSTDEFFREKLLAAPNAPVPIRVKGSKTEALPPTTREQRKILTRRELIRELINGNLTESTLVAESNDPEQAREITPEYFDAVYRAAIEGDFGLAEFCAWDKKVFCHYKPLLSSSYARLLSAQNNPVELLRNTVREESRLYPRPTPITVFEDIPFNFSPEQIEDILQNLNNDPKSTDIRFTTSSLGTVFLYSTRYLEDDYADFLAEHIDVEIAENP